MTPALSAAGAICDHVRDWLLGSPRGDWVSMGVASDGSYGVPPGLFFSFPVTCQHGSWQIVQVRRMHAPCACLPMHAVLQQCMRDPLMFGCEASTRVLRAMLLPGLGD